MLQWRVSWGHERPRETGDGSHPACEPSGLHWGSGARGELEQERKAKGREDARTEKLPRKREDPGLLP